MRFVHAIIITIYVDTQTQKYRRIFIAKCSDTLDSCHPILPDISVKNRCMDLVHRIQTTYYSTHARHL